MPGSTRACRWRGVDAAPGGFVARTSSSPAPNRSSPHCKRAKFVTTPAYAPRLRARRLRELELVEDAAARGWAREVERHRCTVARVEQLLAELGQPVEGPAAPEPEHGGPSA